MVLHVGTFHVIDDIRVATGYRKQRLVFLAHHVELKYSVAASTAAAAARLFTSAKRTRLRFV